MTELLANLNFTDLIAILIVLRLLYVGSTIGVGAQIIPFLWTVCTFFCMIVFYPAFASFLQTHFGIDFSLSVFLSVLILFIACLFVKIVGARFTKNMSPSQLIKIEKYFGMLIAFVRAMFLSGIVFVLLTTVPIIEFEDKVPNSLFASKILVADTKAVYAVVERLPIPEDMIVDSDAMLNGIFRTAQNGVSIVKVFHLEPVDRKKNK